MQLGEKNNIGQPNKVANCFPLIGKRASADKGFDRNKVKVFHLSPFIHCDG